MVVQFLGTGQGSQESEVGSEELREQRSTMTTDAETTRSGTDAGGRRKKEKGKGENNPNS